MKKKVKKPSLTKLKKTLWMYVRSYVKTRDNWRCYTCGVYVRGANAHCGHFIPSSICGLGLRYDEHNLRTQCLRCNVHMSGNYVTFRENLINDNGEKYVLDLEKRRHEATADFNYQALIEYYKKKCEEIGAEVH